METTGLDVIRCEVIERYIHELTHNVSFSNGIIKAKHKIPKEITKLTGITQKEVNDGQDFNVFKNEVKTMLTICNKPIFIAHNGNVFDHQVLKFKDILDGNISIDALQKVTDELQAQGQIVLTNTKGQVQKITRRKQLGLKWQSGLV